MLWTVLLGFALAAIAPLLVRAARGMSGWVIGLYPLGVTAYFAYQLQTILDGKHRTVSYQWAPSLDVNLAFSLDGLSILFALIISGIGTFVFIYAGGYLHGKPQLGRFYSYLLIFMAAMLGLVLADNIIALFVFWELTSISSYLLIGFYYDKKDSREAAKTALIVTGAGGLAMLAGLVLLGLSAGTWEVSEMMAHAKAIQADEFYTAALILIVVGAFSKSAQFPFHFWLPGAMAAPAPVSAYLHSATMVKAGIYLLARLHPVLGGTDEWSVLVAGGGGLTMLVGGYLAWQQTDIKRILAYSTVSALGILVFLLGIGSGLAVKGAMTFLIVHSLYKGALFLVGGTIDHETGSRDILQLGGLGKALPLTAIGAGLAAFSMAGLPPLIGFISKEIIYEATLEAKDLPVILLTGAALLGNLFNVTAAGMVAIRPFFGATTETPKHPHEAPLSMWIGPLFLGILSLGFGLFSIQLLEPLLEHTVAVVYGKTYEVHLGLWHGFTTMLLLSAITIAGGIVLYLLIDVLRSPVSDFRLAAWLSPERGYHLLMDGILGIATFQTQLINRGHLRYFIRIVVVTFAGLIIYVLARDADFSDVLRWPDVRFYEAAIAVMIAVAALAVVQARSRLVAVAALGVVGYGVALLFILFGAPDLAMTQFEIETLTVILFVLVLYRLPKFRAFSTLGTRIRDSIIAVTAGAIMTTLVLIITSEPLQSRLTPFFAENSYTEAKGRNVVNVILVDFRGFDTMGEVTVLAVAAIGVFALLKLNLHTDGDPNEKEDV
ncbi:MAG: putative monovalent cation/H+ antiporter subunit A [Chloroflexi bacterium]|nr:putative monovalent cation/H+ antiporter subunit A [Chloroflexota bacterium]